MYIMYKSNILLYNVLIINPLRLVFRWQKMCQKEKAIMQ